MQPLHAVILAAGDGDRFDAATTRTPKPLLHLAGRPIIAHVLGSLAAAGVRDATVVVGYRAEQMRSALPALAPSGFVLRVVENKQHHHGNARSLWAARSSFRDEPFVLTMADHVVAPALIRKLLESGGDRCRLAVDFCSPDDLRAPEATRAQVVDGRVAELGKDIEPWNALDTGVFWCIRKIADHLTPQLRDGELSAVFSQLAHAGELDAVDVTGSTWIDIDTPDDLARAELMRAGTPGAAGQ